MRGYKAVIFQLSDKVRKILQKFSSSCSLPTSLVLHEQDFYNAVCQCKGDNHRI